MAEITMQELMEKEISGSNEKIVLVDDIFGVALTYKESYGNPWYHLYTRIGAPDKYDVALIRLFTHRKYAIEAFEALTV